MLDQGWNSLMTCYKRGTVFAPSVLCMHDQLRVGGCMFSMMGWRGNTHVATVAPKYPQ